MVVDSAATTWIESGMRADLTGMVGEGTQQLRDGFDRHSFADRRAKEL